MTSLGEPIQLLDLPAMAWKNGSGRTRTLAAEPPTAALGEHVWRVSLAEVDASGEFSAFPGVDRTILLWRGDGVVLQSPSWPDHRLTVPLQPFLFPGEDLVQSALVNGPTQDVNVMVQRGRATSFVFSGMSEWTTPQGWDQWVILAHSGSLQITGSSGFRVSLEEQCFVPLSADHAPLRLQPRSKRVSFVSIGIRSIQ